MQQFTIKKGDTIPPLAVQMLYANGSPVDLTGGSVFFNMGNLDSSAYHSGLATITGSTTGNVQWNWDTISTGSPGNYWGEFEFIIGGSRLTLPTDNSLRIQVNEDYN